MARVVVLAGIGEREGRANRGWPLGERGS